MMQEIQNTTNSVFVENSGIINKPVDKEKLSNYHH